MGISDITSSMKTAAIVLALALGVSCDTLGGHSHGHGHGLRQGRQEEALGAYGQPQYGDDLDTAASDASDPLAMLQSAVPGVPGEDYPIYAEVPETAFTCDGQVDGGYYADGEAECQVFHIRTADGAGGLAKYSFLCPNGTVFNQNYFICDWWFNFDCAEAEDSTLSMTNTLLREMLLMLVPVMPRLTTLPPLLLMLDMLLLLNMKVLKVLAEQGVRDLQAVLTGDKANPLVLTTLIDQNLKTLYLYF